MTRLIDADLLKESLKESRDRAVEWHNDCKEHSSDEFIARSEQAVMTFNECIMRTNSMPTVDAEPVVRCKDCRFSHMTYGGDCKSCDKWVDDDDFHLTLYLDGNFYCAWGERREDG